jgi:hypothetical protein
MDVELQVLKHLAQDAQATVPIIDEYCQALRSPTVFRQHR